MHTRSKRESLLFHFKIKKKYFLPLRGFRYYVDIFTFTNDIPRKGIRQWTINDISIYAHPLVTTSFRLLESKIIDGKVWTL